MQTTVSLHISRKEHAVCDRKKLKEIERHNSRRKCSKGYDGVLNYDLFGKATRIVEDTENFINEKFQPFIDEYNEKQSRNDRKINISPFDFFEKKSQTQIAVETIFQIGRKELWDSMRELCLNDDIIFQGFKSQINDIYLEIIKEVSEIYSDHKIEILQKMRSREKECNLLIDGLSDEAIADFDALEKMDSEDRNLVLHEEGDAYRENYYMYIDAKKDLAVLKTNRLIERVENDQLHLEIINASLHFDEFLKEGSPHAHIIVVPYADGYTRGLKTQLAKSLVFNKWMLEVSQDLVHDLSKREVDENPGLFAGGEILAKQKGRNRDFSKEMYIKQKYEAMEKETKQLDEKISKQFAESENLKHANSELMVQSAKQTIDIQRKNQQMLEVEQQLTNENAELLRVKAEKEEAENQALMFIEQRKRLSEELVKSGNELYRVQKQVDEEKAKLADISQISSDLEYYSISDFLLLKIRKLHEILRKIKLELEQNMKALTDSIVALIKDMCAEVKDMVDYDVRRLEAYEHSNDITEEANSPKIKRELDEVIKSAEELKSDASNSTQKKFLER